MEEGTNFIAATDANVNIIGNAAVDLIMATMPNPQRRGYFGPRKDRPPQETSRRLARRRSTRAKNNDLAPEVVQDANEDAFPPFNLGNDISVGQFVALAVEPSEVRGGVSFYLGKVLEFGQRRWALKMKVVWYWPTMRHGAQEDAGSNRVRYRNCMESTWEPSGERFAWIEKEAGIYLWVDVPRQGKSGHVVRSSIVVLGVQTEETVIIPVEAKPHLLEYMAMHMEDLDDQRLQNDLNMY